MGLLQKTITLNYVKHLIDNMFYVFLNKLIVKYKIPYIFLIIVLNIKFSSMK